MLVYINFSLELFCVKIYRNSQDKKRKRLLFGMIQIVKASPIGAVIHTRTPTHLVESETLHENIFSFFTFSEHPVMN